LQSLGHSASHALQSFPPGVADAILFAQAQAENSVLVTTDKDFFHTIPLAYELHAGAIVITLRRPNRGGLLQRLSDALVHLGERGDA
jgi:predicted nuclease of predicted toxin-antitoxin system